MNDRQKRAQKIIRTMTDRIKATQAVEQHGIAFCYHAGEFKVYVSVLKSVATGNLFYKRMKINAFAVSADHDVTPEVFNAITRYCETHDLDVKDVLFFYDESGVATQ